MLHEAITDEQSRLGLMRIFNFICDLVAAHLRSGFAASPHALIRSEITRRNWSGPKMPASAIPASRSA